MSTIIRNQNTFLRDLANNSDANASELLENPLETKFRKEQNKMFRISKLNNCVPYIVIIPVWSCTILPLYAWVLSILDMGNIYAVSFSIRTHRSLHRY